MRPCFKRLSVHIVLQCSAADTSAKLHQCKNHSYALLVLLLLSTQDWILSVPSINVQNMAANSSNSSPAYCEINGPGCRDGTFDDAAMVERDAARRRAMKDAQSKASAMTVRPIHGQRSPKVPASITDGEEARDRRVQDLEAKVSDLIETISTMNKTVNVLADMLKEFMRAANSTNTSGN